jgi:protein SCO1/2
VLLATPDGRISRVLYGVEYAPRDLRLGLIEAAENKIGTPVDQLLLFCFHYDPATGKYTTVVMNILRLTAGATLAVLLGLIVVLVRRDRATLRPRTT